METLETVGLVIFASLFILSGWSHIKNHTVMVSYARPAFGDCPIGDQLAFLGGTPTGVLLTAAGVGAAFGEPVALYALAGFLAVAAVLFHRNFLTDPSGFKTISLAGAALALAVTIG